MSAKVRRSLVGPPRRRLGDETPELRLGLRAGEPIPRARATDGSEAALVTATTGAPLAVPGLATGAVAAGVERAGAVAAPAVTVGAAHEGFLLVGRGPGVRRTAAPLVGATVRLHRNVVNPTHRCGP